ncbi:MAG: tripartite tricarboxylate transporter substrate binding protein [Proteobacteria bacterium]|nr:tripartite tricarboxylate transporter substrate binding protein [Pseudomonadota bacterium]
MSFGRRVFVGAAASAAIVSRARAEDFPNRPLRILVPFTPGGTTDILAREIAAKLQASMGQSVIVDNKPGAGGTLGCEMVARAEPDGYLMLMGHIGTLAINPLVYPRHSYDPVKGWTALSYCANVPNVLAVNSSLPATDVKELVALAKAKPGSLAYGTGGTATASHLAAAYFAYATGTEFLHVPYKGTAPFVSDLLAGQLQMGFTGAPVVMPLAKQGRLRALAISSTKRSAAFPDLPTVAESGYPGFEADQWYGITGPAGIDPAIARKLNAEINKALASADVKARLEKEGGEPVIGPTEALEKHLATEIERWRPVVKAANIKLE